MWHNEQDYDSPLFQEVGTAGRPSTRRPSYSRILKELQEDVTSASMVTQGEREGEFLRLELKKTLRGRD